ncbi:MAG: peptidoglycan DD-metalloendopeptidase family protein [Bacteroidales bacterium]|nr:peptidoglycan DD-metalloendopeptidase family protein [Bacteroidales bacterium]MBN2758184.1 peptidoglycan DD-metalloendopeptidase family protein [Bacteroidales bacterium]
MNIYKLKFVFLLILLLFSFKIISQNRNYYKNLKEKDKKAIEYSNKLIKELEIDKSGLFDKLLVIKSKLENQENIVSTSKREIRLLSEEINNEELRIAQLNFDLKRLKDEYQKLIYFAYLNNSMQDRMIYILSADNFNSAFKRITYLKQLTVYRKEAYQSIESRKILIDSSLVVLKNKQDEKKELIENLLPETTSLKVFKQNLQYELDKLDYKIDELKTEIIKEENKNEQIKNKVTNEISNTSKNVKSNNKAYNLNVKIGNNFANFKSKHIWPLSNYVIIHKFGDYYHPILKDIIVKNDGIVLASKKGVNVYSIFDGQIINIIEIPGNGTSIIIKHGDYYSVYSNVFNVEVTNGQIVKTGQQIARLSKDNKLAKINFQLWKGKEKLNPQLWLKK